MDDMNPYGEEDLDEEEVVDGLDLEEEKSSEHEW